MKILVTGAAGFLGSHVSEALVKQGHDVLAVDDLSAGQMSHVPDGVRLNVVSILSPVVTEIIEREKPDVILHMAALTGERRVQEDAASDLAVNVEGTVALALAAMRCGVRRFVFASSAAVYAPDVMLPARENAQGHPVTSVGRAKLAAEKFLESLARVHGLEVVSLRYSNVYGPRQSPTGEVGVVSIFGRRMLGGQAAIIFGSGRQTRDFVYVKDAVDATVRSITGRPGVYNIGSGTETSILTIYRTLARLTKFGLARVHGPAVRGEVEQMVLDIGAARKYLAYNPSTPLEVGLEATVHSFRRRTPTRWAPLSDEAMLLLPERERSVG